MSKMAPVMAKKYERAFALITGEGGKPKMPVEQACQKAGVHYGNYYNWRNKKYPALKRPQAKALAKGTRLIALPESMPSSGKCKVIILVGDAHDIVNAAKELM